MRTTRRAAMTASGAAVLGLSACTSADSGARSPASSESPTTSTGTEPTDADPDRESLERAFAITSALIADLAASRPVIDIGGELAEIHTAHLAALEAAAGAVVPTASPSTPHRLTVARLRSRELAAQRELAALARAAESGPLARLLASMSAGIAAGLSHRGEVPR